jgi:hypothetical protein
MRFPVVVLDGLRDSIEVPLLGFGVVSPSLKGYIVCTNALNNSVEWELRDEVEWSVDVESEIFINTLSLDCVSLIKVDNLPLLVSSALISPYSNCLAFFILSSFDIKNFAALPVDELVVFILEYLEPS